MKDNWQELQDKINEWADQTFGPEIDVDRMVDHLKEETEELRADPFNPVSFADLMILIMRLAKHSELNMSELFAVCEAKFVINSNKRVWVASNGKRYTVVDGGSYGADFEKKS